MRNIIKSIIASTPIMCAFLAQSIYASSFDITFNSLKTNEWYEVPNSKLAEQIDPNVYLPGDINSIMSAWSGAAFDTTRDRLVVWGGGHSDYSGNELYAFDINNLAWKRLNTASADVSGTTEPFYQDGGPRARHTYNYIEYLPNIDRFVSFGGSSPFPAGGGTFTHLVSEFNFNNLQWNHARKEVPEKPNMVGAFAAYDSVTGYVWFHGSMRSSLSSYNPENDTWQVYTPSTYLSIYCTPAIDPIRRLLICVGGYGGERQIFAWDLNKPNSKPYSPPTTGATNLEYVGAPGFEYDPILKRFVGSQGGEYLYVLDPETWKWTKVSPASTNTVTPTNGAPHGTYGRFKYIPSKNAYILVNRANENVYIYKLSNAPAITQPMKPSNPNSSVNQL